MGHGCDGKMTALEGLIWGSFSWSIKRGVLKASRVRSRTATIRVEDTPFSLVRWVESRPYSLSCGRQKSIYECNIQTFSSIRPVDSVLAV